MKKIIITQDIKIKLDQKDNFLNRADIRIFPAVSNEEALKIHMAERANVIIADLDEHVLNGERFCSTIRDSKELCRVSLIILHSAGTEDVHKISACRANAFIEKTADPAIVIEKARELLSIPMRETYRAPIGIMVNCENMQNPFLGYSENISVTGMLLDSEKTFAKGEIISCSFVLSDSTHVRTEAEIVRISSKASEHDTNQYGVRFLNLDQAFKAAIDDYVSKSRRRQ
jgi:DNA-binding response OmpR family regulator